MKTVNVWFQTRQGSGKCPNCSRRLADMLTAEEVAGCRNAEELKRLSTRHYTHGWYQGVTWRTGAAFCRECVFGVLSADVWEPVRRAVKNGVTSYALCGRSCGIPAWLQTAWDSAMSVQSPGPVSAAVEVVG